MKALNVFPFADCSDEELIHNIGYCEEEISLRLEKREFKGIQIWGKTLINLENEKKIRELGIH